MEIIKKIILLSYIFSTISCNPNRVLFEVKVDIPDYFHEHSIDSLYGENNVDFYPNNLKKSLRFKDATSNHVLEFFEIKKVTKQSISKKKSFLNQNLETLTSDNPSIKIMDNDVLQIGETIITYFEWKEDSLSGISFSLDFSKSKSNITVKYTCYNDVDGDKQIIRD